MINNIKYFTLLALALIRQMIGWLSLLCFGAGGIAVVFNLIKLFICVLCVQDAMAEVFSTLIWQFIVFVTGYIILNVFYAD